VQGGLIRWSASLKLPQYMCKVLDPRKNESNKFVSSLTICQVTKKLNQLIKKWNDLIENEMMTIVHEMIRKRSALSEHMPPNVRPYQINPKKGEGLYTIYIK
jgi:hypothetical protein